MIAARRKWWMAGLLGIAATCLGQVYNGQVRKGVLFYGLTWVVALVSIMAISLPIAPFNIAIPFIAVISMYLYILIDAIYSAKRIGNNYQPRFYDKWYIYLIAILATWFVLQPILSYVTRRFLAQAYRIPSGAMIPTLLVGDHILVYKLDYRFRSPNRGDIIVFKYPKNEKRDFIKRVIGLPGERVEIRNKRVYINGSLLKEPYAIFNQDESFLESSVSNRDNYGPVTVPLGHLFMMGDNRDNSMDSRFWGFLDESKIRGKVRTIYLSWNSETHRVRWERIGQAVR